MSKNWLTHWAEGKESVPAQKSALAARQSEFARKVEQLRIASGKIESRRVQFICARTSGQFHVDFERVNAKERFRIARIEKDLPTTGFTKNSGGNAQSELSFNVDELNIEGFRCPWCNTGDDFVHCGSCKQCVCFGGVTVRPDGTNWFVCHDGCGASGRPARRCFQVNGSAAPRRAETGRPALPGRSQAALPAGSNALRLGGPRR
jgi:hypothetical protein